ncbi:SCO2400 family protein [Streptomyces sp. 4F14]|uniref:SCO2400 family protein n=1 Tax=Streptomyces sp. 4F14 TaxID=3394380 RepID=UPI003A8B44B6
MDYCSTCRRHLNGALVCPGCGAYAPDIAPLPGGAPAPIASGTAAQVQHAFPAETRQVTPYDASFDTEPAETAYDADTPYDSAVPDGRAARRRQRERWKKTQRRALVATAVALVGGGLTVSSMNRHSTDRTQAASAPDRETMGVAEEEIGQPTPGTSLSDAQRTTPGTAPGRSSAARGTGAGTDTTGSTPSAPSAHTPNTPRGQAAAQPQAAPVSGRSAQQATPAAPSTGSTGASTTPGGSGTATQPTPAPSPTPSGDSASGTGSSGSGTSGSGTSGSGTSGSGTSGSGTSSDATDPAGLCLLGLVCIT